MTISLEGDDCLQLLAGVLASFMRRNLNRSRGYFEVSLTWRVQGPLPNEKGTLWNFAKGSFGLRTHIPIGNSFGRRVIDPSKQLMLFMWYMANQELTRLVADRFDVTYSSVSRIMHWITKGIMALRNQNMRWPNGEHSVKIWRSRKL